MSLAPRHPFSAPPDRMDGPAAAGAPFTGGITAAKEGLRAAQVRDVDWLIKVAEEYRKGLLGEPSRWGLQDIDHVVRQMNDRVRSNVEDSPC